MSKGESEEVEEELEEEAKKKNRKVSKEVYYTGSVVRMLKAWDEDTWRMIEDEARAKGTTVPKIVMEYVKKGYISRQETLSRISVQDMYLVYDMIRELMRDAIHIYTSMSSVFFSEMTRAFGEVIEAKVQERLSRMQQPDKAKFAEMMEKILTPLLQSMVAQMMAATGLKPPKVRIPVEYEES
jgi:hypothetical protein